MIDSFGKRLSEARLAKGLSVDEAAHATKVRPDKILALENDDYSRFASAAYAKGFLLLYGRYLGVDVSEQAKSLETPRTVSIQDYQYLNNAPEPEPERVHVRRRRDNAPPALIPLLVFGVMLVMAGLGFNYWVNYQRVTATSTNLESNETAAPAEPSSSVAAPASSEPRNVATNPEAAAGAEERPTNPAPSTRPESPSLRDPLPTDESPAPGRRSEPVHVQGEQIAVEKELVLEPLRKTWVEVRRKEGVNVEVLFADFLYAGTDVKPLRKPGKGLYYVVRDPESCRILRDGIPTVYHAPGIAVQ